MAVMPKEAHEARRFAASIFTQQRHSCVPDVTYRYSSLYDTFSPAIYA